MRKATRQIWVYGDLRNEKFFGLSLNILAKAAELAQSVDTSAAMVLLKTSDNEKMSQNDLLPISDAAERAIKHGAGTVYIIDGCGLDILRPDAFAFALSEAVSKQNPMLFCFPLTDFCRELAARLARSHGGGLIADCVDLTIKNGSVIATSPAWGGRIMAEITYSDESRTGFATVAQNIATPSAEEGKPGNIEELEVDCPYFQEELELLSRLPEEKDPRDIEHAEIVVAGGAGMRSAEGFSVLSELAAALGGQLGATRPPVLNHWIDEKRLIGQTGKTIRPRLLISVGTSGAVQYTAGIEDSEKIVAVNRDKKASIFEMADIGIVANADTFVPLFTSLVKTSFMKRLADDITHTGKPEAKSGFGQMIRKLREAGNWTLEKLAETTDQSPDFIRQVENDEVAPSVSFLLRLARAFKVDPGTFLGEEQKNMIRDRRTEAYIKRTENYSYQTLTPGAENEHLRAFMISIESRQDHKPVAYKHEGEEFVFVLEGKIELTLSGKPQILNAGESLRFNSEIPHKLRNFSDDLSRCLVVLYTP